MRPSNRAESRTHSPIRAGFSQLDACLTIWGFLAWFCVVEGGFAPPAQRQHTVLPLLSSSRRPLSSSLTPLREGTRFQEEANAAVSRLRNGNNGAGKSLPVGVFNPFLFQVFDPSEKDTEHRALALSFIENSRVLTSTLSSWAKSSVPDASDRCYEVLDHLRDHGDRHRGLPINSYLYSVVINAFAKRGRAQDAESVLREALEDATSGRHIMKNNYMFNSVISAWRRSSDGGGADNCNRLLTEMENFAESGRKELSPDIGTYNTVMNAYIVDGRIHEAECLLREMLVNKTKLAPNIVSFNCILKAWSDSSRSDAPDRCRKLLDAMKHFSDQQHGLTPDVLSYGYVLRAYEKHARVHDAEVLLREMILSGTILPNARCFSHVMRAWIVSGAVDAPDQCLRLFRVMEHLQVQKLRRSDREDEPRKQYPPMPLYKIVIGALASGGRGREAEVLMLEMTQKSKIIPDVECFNLVAKAWSKSTTKDAPKRCRGILNGMTRLSEKLNGGEGATLAPNTETYKTVIDAFARFGQPEEAESVLRAMLKAAERTNCSITPDVVCFNMVMNAWSNSNFDDGSNRCMQLLRLMQEQYVRSGNFELEPDVLSHNIVISSFADRGQAAEAQRLLQQMMQDNNPTPNVVSFNLVMHGWSKSDADDAPERCMKLLEEMRDMADRTDACLDETTIYAVTEAFSSRGREEEALDLLKPFRKE